MEGGVGLGEAGGAGGGSGFFWYGKKKARLVMAAKSDRSSLSKVSPRTSLVFNCSCLASLAPRQLGRETESQF